MKTKGKSAEIQLLTGLFFRLLPFQVLLIVINAVNGIVDSLYASNAIGKSAMSAIGLFGPFNHFLYAASMLFVSGSQMLYGNRKRCPRSFEDWMDIPPRIGVEADHRIDISVRGMEEVVGVSGQVIAFCRRLGLDERRAFFAGLCMEEMAGNVVTHGFTKDAKPHSADIRVVHKDNELILRIRDNCAGFDPVEYVQMMEQEDEAGRNVGIRLVYEIAEGIQYQNLLGMNVLAIRI